MREYITICKQELIELVADVARNASNNAIDQTLKELGIRTESMWISQNKAHKIVGRKRLETAIRQGRVRYRKPDMDNPRGRVHINKKDIQNLLNRPG